MKKKVLHILIRGYVEEYSYQENLLSQKHSELGYDVYFVTGQLYLDKNKRKALHPVGEYTNKYGVKVSVLPSATTSNLKAIFMDQTIGLYEKISEISPDIIFMHNFPYKDVRHIVKYAKLHPEVKVFADCHTDYYNSAYNTMYGKLKSFFARYHGHELEPVTKTFWGTTPWRVDFMRDIYKLPVQKLDLLIMGADERNIEGVNKIEVRSKIRKSYGIPENAFVIVTGGKIDKRKKQDLLMEAVSRLKDKNVWLIIFGTPTDEMQPIVDRYKECSNIIMPGWMDAEGKFPLFFASDMACFPGTHSVLWEEAVACGLPAIYQYWEGMAHVNYNGNALLLKNINVELLAETINSLCFTEKYYDMLQKAQMASPNFFLKQLAYKAIGETPIN